MDPITAVTHPDPYPYYADLVARRPIHRDETLGVWVAASAAAVRSVLTSDLCRVRPPAEPVPRAIAGSPAGAVFGQLVRMNDGAAHLRLKPTVSATLAMLDPGRVSEQAARWARHLADELQPAAHAERLTDFGFRLPVYVVASLLGVAPADLPRTAESVGDFVRGIAPGSTPEQIARGNAAAEGLAQAFCRLLRRDRLDAGVANTIGYLSQSYEATAGLIGNALVTLGRHREVREMVARDPGALRPIVSESYGTMRLCRPRDGS